MSKTIVQLELIAEIFKYQFSKIYIKNLTCCQS